jgi:predicted enzyme related to lactoylglutathione lyase
MHSVSLSIDVPDLATGVRFYTSAFGFSKSAEPVPGVAVLRAGQTDICLLEKRAGSRASTRTDQTRHYDRHWTPVHLDIHVEDLEVALAKALAAGATREQLFENPAHGSVAFCSDPFGHGFCLIEKKR